MLNNASKTKSKKDMVGKMADTVSEETEKIGESISTQIFGNNTEQSNPIAEAMQQKTEEETEKQNTVNIKRKFIQTREELDRQLHEIQKRDEEQKKTWSEEVDRQFKITNPGEGMEEKPAIPLSSKPKRGMMRGKPGTAKGETGPEVRKSQQ
jgi:hypothetical protein